MSKESRLRFMVCMTSTMALSGCVAAGGYSNQMAAPLESLKNGDANTALTQIAAKKKDDADLLYNLEYGEVARLQTPENIKQSSDAFLKADADVQHWEDETRTNLEKPAGQIGAYLLSDSLRTFEGQDYEKSLLSQRLAVDHLLNGDWESARVEIRKLTDRETLIKDYRDKEYEALAEAATAKGVNPNPNVSMIQGYPVEIFNDPEVLGLKNAYQSAASHYLAGFVFEALGEPSLAAPGYRQAIELRPNSPVLKEALKQLGHRKLKKDETDVLFLVETGFLSPIISKRVTLPIPTPKGVVLVSMAYPIIYPSQDVFDPSALEVDDKQVPLSLVTNIDAMSRLALKNDMPAMMIRSTSRAMVSAATQVALQQMNTNQNGQNNNALGQLLALGVGAASAATAHVDTRHWSTLPAEIFLGRATLKTGPNAIVVNTPAGPRTLNAEVTGKHAVIYVRVMRNGAVLLSSPAEKPVETAGL